MVNIDLTIFQSEIFMRLRANTRPLRVIVNIIAGLYAVVVLISSFTVFGSLGSTPGFGGVVVLTLATLLVSAVGLYLFWKLIHMFLDMYEAIAEMQGKMARFE